MVSKVHSRFFLVLAVLLLWGQGPLAADPPLEAKVKTAYIFNILQFVHWPEDAVREDPASIRIAVLGVDPVGDLLEELSKSPMDGWELKIERCSDESELSLPAQIVYISRPLEPRLPEILQTFQGKSVLTVSDIGQFSKRGGVIGFFQERGKVKIEINLRTAREAGLKIDARLLEIGRVIR